MNLADLTLVSSSFVEKTIRTFHPHKALAPAPYGVDMDFRNSRAKEQGRGPLRFIADRVSGGLGRKLEMV
jgi:hypothetical protein